MKMGWPETTLEAVLLLNRSGYWGDEAPSESRPCEVKVVRNADLTKTGALRGYATRHFSEKEARNSAFEIHDVAMSASGDIGKLWEVDTPEYFASNFVRILRPDLKLIAPGFLRLALCTESVRNALVENTVGTTIQNLQKGFYSSAKFLLPPLAEQQRIVGLLDEAFAGIVTAQANAEKNLRSAHELLESHLRSVFTQRGKRWMRKPLGIICDFSQGVQVDVKLQSETERDQSQVRFLRIVDFTQGNEPERFIDNPGKKFIVCQSDISLVRYGASTGFVCRGLEGAIANNLFRVIPKEGQVSNEFLYWFLKAPAFQDEIKKIMNGAAMPAISFGVINEIAVVFPPQQEQPAIVSMLDSFAGETQRLARLYERKLAALEALKKSLLHQAFTGEL